jgi:hypothetical protein
MILTEHAQQAKVATNAATIANGELSNSGLLAASFLFDGDLARSVTTVIPQPARLKVPSLDRTLYGRRRKKLGGDDASAERKTPI